MEEEKITKENENDMFKCPYCKEESTRKSIRTIFTSIPFCEEEKKEYYCGCMGWD